jgi:hypothetical protein
MTGRERRAMITSAVIAVVLVAALVAIANYGIVFPRQPWRGPLPPLSAEQQLLAQRLREHVTAVASRPHNIGYAANLEAAARAIEARLASFGLTSAAQIYEVDGHSVRNIEVVIEPAAGAVRASYVIGAHYDSPDDSPGANDNGTGVAALIELARLFAATPPGRDRLRLVFFVNEEAPYHKSAAMGSWRYAKRLSDSGERLAGMLALETLGYFSDAPGSQKYPWPFNLIYPDTGNFVAFVGLPGARSLVGRTLRAFRRHAAFPAIGGVAPGFIPGIDLSDHWAFHQFGYPAAMLTDTAPYRNPFYHRLNDLPKNVDYESLARITTGLERMLREIAE